MKSQNNNNSYEQLIESDEQLIENMTTELKNDQDEGKRDQEHQDLYEFTLPLGLRLVLCQLVKNSTKDQQDQFNAKSITLSQSKKPTAPHNTQPTTPHNNCKSAESYYTNPNHKPYAIWESNSQLQITNPM